MQKYLAFKFKKSTPYLKSKIFRIKKKILKKYLDIILL